MRSTRFVSVRWSCLLTRRVGVLGLLSSGTVVQLTTARQRAITVVRLTTRGSLERPSGSRCSYVR